MRERRKALRIITGRRLVRIVVEDLGVTLYAAYSTDYDRLYLLVPGRFCSCASFLFDVVLRRAAERCVHLEALREARDVNITEMRVDLTRFTSILYPLLFKGIIS